MTTETTTPAEHITIALPQQPADHQQRVGAAQAWATHLQVTTADERTTASTGVARLKKLAADVKAEFAEPKQAAHRAHKSITALERKLLIPIESATEVATSKILAYDRAEERKRQAAAARLAAAAAAAAEAERRRLEALAKRCTKDEEKAEMYREAAETVTAAPVIMPEPAAAEARAVAGEIRRRVWRAELTDKAALIKAAAEGNAAAEGLLLFDATAANKAAVAFKRDGVVPGVRFFEEMQLSHRL